MPIKSSYYLPSAAEYWQGLENSESCERLFQIIQRVDLQQTLPVVSECTFALLGFASDRGVKRNFGRLGASEGPQAIRHHLANLAIHQPLNLVDAGDVISEGDELEAAQQVLADATAQLHEQHYRPILLGGGHEITWGHYQGLAQAKLTKGLGIINFNHHLDLKAVSSNGLGSSGTPFRQIATHCEEHERRFEYCCIGIQPTANTQSLYAYAEEQGVQGIEAKTVHQQFGKTESRIKAFSNKQSALYVSISLEVFAQAFAPGVSAPNAYGLTPYQVFDLLEIIFASGKVVSVEITELAPCFDRDDQTARLAATLVAWILRCWG